MNKLRWLAILIGVAVIIIAGFQVYWLKDNYGREKAALVTKTDALFRDLVSTMQDSLMQQRVREALRDTSAVHTRINTRPIRKMAASRPFSGRMINVIRRSMNNDSVTNNPRRTSRIYRSTDQGGTGQGDSLEMRTFLDSIDPNRIKEVRVIKRPDRISRRLKNDSVARADIEIRGMRGPARQRVQFDSIEYNGTVSGTLLIDNINGDQVMVRLDSLFNDTLRLTAIDSAFGKALLIQNIDAPFSVSTVNPSHNDRIRGLDPSMRYNLTLGNATPYLLKQISAPILFSFFLVGLTLFSFIILYRSLSRQQKLAQLKNDFISNITHELKTPIATVSVAIEALRDFNAMRNPEKTKEYLEISSQELERLGLLVDKVLKLSMFEAKKMDINPESIDMAALAANVVNTMKVQLEKYGAAVHVSTSGEVTVSADRLHMTSVLMNLLDNSLKYSKDSPVVNITVNGTSDKVILEVTDNGIGIPAQYKTKVFEKFFRVPSGNRHNTKGYGLGLSYVAHVVRQHAGTIELVSTPETGSKFIITLPKNHVLKP